MKPGPKPINARRALQLCDLGLTYRAIGVQLAREEGRPVAYGEGAVHKAVNRIQGGR